MTVYVVPVGPDRYELYYEHSSEPVSEDVPASEGVFARFQRKFAELLRAAETAHQRRNEAAERPASWTSRVQTRLLVWIADRIAEQRLLWNLRRQDRVIAAHDPDVPFERLLDHIRRALKRDFDRHRFWLVIDTVGMVASAFLTIIPGPNLLAYYFVFRVGGHWLSMQGAVRGRSRIEWANQPCEALGGLRAALALPDVERKRRVAEIALALHLEHLPAFVEREWKAAKKAHPV